MATARTPREAWVEAGLVALAAGGPDAVRVEALAASLGVTKGGFYGYFAGREALLEEMLDRWERDVTEDIIERVDRAGGDARERLRLLGSIAMTGDGLATGIETDLAIRDWARRDPNVAERLRRVDNRRMDYLREQLAEITPDPDEVEVRAHVMFALYLAEHFMVADHGGRTRREVADLTMSRLLAPSAPPARPDA